ncbi:helix-turn-helix domain-containing protein [Streptomyces sp. CC228A]|uniref:winged helix-turn-helix transcriptional regulator n=1 Tax=Streptomyces sp. CC228A TaxID=2898186 RepID=UPI001F433CD1|nr:helix-turn-helix domain-containing protein [Streptomyces sp. CC228A]
MSVGHTGVTTEAGLSCAEDCGVRDVQDRLGDKATAHVVVGPAGGIRRFRELQRLAPGISQRTPTLTPRRPERDGLVTRTVHPVAPPQGEYVLTETGRSMTGPIKAPADRSLAHRGVIAEARRACDERQGTP